MPLTFEKFQEMKYNNENEWKAIKHDYFVKINQRFMQEKLSFYHPYTNEKLFIPKNTIFDKVGTIAKGNEIREVSKLIEEYGGSIMIGINDMLI